MKKLFKVLKIAVIVFVILTIVGVGVLYVVFPPNKIKNMAQDFVRKNYSREIDYDGFSFTLVGVKVKNFKISEVGTFDNGTFLQADNLTVKAELLPLLHKKIEIKKLLLRGIKINIIKNQDGTFNFDNFTSGNTKEVQPQEVQNSGEQNSNFAVEINNISLENSSFYYSDKQSDMEFKVENVNLSINKFSLNQLFPFTLNLQTSLDMGAAKINPLILDFQGKVNLADLNLKDAYADIEPFALSYKTAKISFTGKVQNFENPVIDLVGKIDGVNNGVITSITPVDLPNFALPPAGLILKAEAKLDVNTVNIQQADLNLGKSYIKNDAVIDYSSAELAYKANTTFNLFLNDIYESAKEMLKEIAPKGDIGGNLNIFSQKSGPDMKGKISLANVGAILAGKELKNFNGLINISSLKNIKTNIMSGSYDDSNFKTSLSYSQPAKPINLDFMLDLDKFTLNDINFDEIFAGKSQDNEKKKQSVQKTEEKKPEEKADFGTYNIKLDVKVKEVANNVLTAKDLVLNADVKNFSNDFKTLQGSLNFSSGEGEIRDINKLMGSSKLAAAAFSAVKVIYQVFAAAKLDNLSLGTGNVIKYSEIEGAYTIKDGLVNLDKSTIISNLLTVKASGTIDLVTEKLDMTVNTHFGKVDAGSAFKPVVLKIKGTMSDPKYSVDVLSSVTSIMNIPTNVFKTGVKASTNTASGVASGIKGVASAIGNLF